MYHPHSANAPSIIFMGPPKSGKGRAAQAAGARHGGDVFSSGEALRQAKERRAAAELMAAGNLVDPDDFKAVFSDFVGGTADPDRLLVLDGVARMAVEAPWVYDQLHLSGRPLARVIVLDIDRETAQQRLRESGRADDDPAVQATRWTKFEHETVRSIAFFRTCGYVDIIDGRATPEAVDAEVDRILLHHGFIPAIQPT